MHGDGKLVKAPIIGRAKGLGQWGMRVASMCDGSLKGGEKRVIASVTFQLLGVGDDHLFTR
jgi:hypothetical protein